MADQELLKEFPDISSKLAAPKKISAFEKDRQDAAAKRERDEQETAAALREFEDEFGADENGAQGRHGSYGGYGMPSMPGAPPSQKRRREMEAMREMSKIREDEEEQDDRSMTDFNRSSDFNSDRRQKEAPKPTVQLSSLPVNTTEKIVMDLLQDRLPVYSVRMIHPEVSGSAKRSLSAIATLESGTTNAQIDHTVSALKDKYMGLGHFLSISRHLSSAALHPSISGLTATSSEPFGAERNRESQRESALRNAPPPRDHRGYAPPDSYHPDSTYKPSAPDGLQVTVCAPGDIHTMRAVHLLADRLLAEPSTQRAMQVEALLMSIPSVQKDARFAFLFDARNPAGVYYRYLLWSDDDPNEAVQARLRQPQSIQKIFADSDCDWLLPSGAITFPDLTDMADIVDDIDYASSDEESDGEDGRKRYANGRDDLESTAVERHYMTPLERARLVHLLCRLPKSHSILRKGDVARITNFAISHAGTGAEDLVGLLLLNVVKPFSYSLAARYEDSDEGRDEEDEYEPDEALPSVDDDNSELPKESRRDDDPSSAKLVALFVISDILAASATAGAKNVWKYRQLFEKGFEMLKIFPYLGKLDKELQWGRIKAEQWKRRVGQVFDLWESWSTFKTDVLEHMKQEFFEPPLSASEKADVKMRAAEEEKRKKQADAREKIQAMKDKLKAAELNKVETKMRQSDRQSPDISMIDTDPPSVRSNAGNGHGADEGEMIPNSGADATRAAPSSQRKRMRAEDMFADSDDD